MFHIKLALSFVIAAKTASAPATRMSVYLIDLPSEPVDRFQSKAKATCIPNDKDGLPLQLPEPQRDCEQRVRNTDVEVDSVDAS